VNSVQLLIEVQLNQDRERRWCNAPLALLDSLVSNKVTSLL